MVQVTGKVACILGLWNSLSVRLWQLIPVCKAGYWYKGLLRQVSALIRIKYAQYQPKLLTCFLFSRIMKSSNTKGGRMQKLACAHTRKDFPGLEQTMHGKPLVFLDSAASAQKPQAVIDAVTEAYTHNYANIHRAVYTLSDQATDAFEHTRHKVADFINATSASEIVFTKGTTEAFNFLATSLGEAYLNPGDEVILTVMEHHANIVPWQMLARKMGVVLKYVMVDRHGVLNYEEFDTLINEKTALISISHCSNVLGTVNDIRAVVARARRYHIPVAVDGAQSVVHQPIDVRDLGCDFFTFSSHKLYGPTGVGVLYLQHQWLEWLPPYQGGGDMINQVSLYDCEYAEVPHRFEAGTPNIVGVTALSNAIDYVQQVGMANIQAHEQALSDYAHHALREISGLEIIGEAPGKAALTTFVIDGAQANDLGTLLDLSGVAVRTGHHCAQPLQTYYGLPATVRASFAMYNTYEDVDTLIRGLHKAIKMLR